MKKENQSRKERIAELNKKFQMLLGVEDSSIDLSKMSLAQVDALIEQHWDHVITTLRTIRQ